MEPRHRTSAYYRLGKVPVEGLLALARSIGTPIPSRKHGPLVDLLFARHKGTTDRSLGDIYGRDAFPLHTDMAYLVKPPRFLLLMCPRPTSTPTVVCTPQKLLQNRSLMTRLLSEVFLVKGHRFLASILSVDRGHARWRYDPHCMLPTTERGSALLSELSNELRHERVSFINWVPGEAMMLSNDLVLHAREAVPAKEDRYLYRIAIS